MLDHVEPDEGAGEGTLLEQLAAALRRMTRLTAVLLERTVQQDGREGGVLAALAELPRLQRLCLFTYGEYYDEEDGPAPCLPLPLGPYSASLRMLGTSVDCLNRSVKLLASCGELEHIAVMCGDCNRPGRFWRWAAARRRSLRRVQAPHEYEYPGAAYGATPFEPVQVLRLQEARPQLDVACIEPYSFAALFLWQDPFADDEDM